MEVTYSKVKTLLDTANRYYETRDFMRAEECLKQAFAADPVNFLTLFQLSKFYYTQKNYGLAEIYFLKTIKIKPDIAGLYSVLGIIQKELGKFKSAEQSYLRAIQLDPQFDEAYYNLGILVYVQNKLVDAIEYFNATIKINDRNYLAHYNLGNVYRELEKYDEALWHYNRPIEIKNDFADGYHNLGVVEEQQYDYEKALQHYNLALKHDFQHVSSRWNRALILLLLQKYEKGFKEYEWRKKRKEYPQRNYSKPELTDQSINGKTLFVYDDQGLGDTIQFSRYLLMLKELGASVVFECDKKLTGLFSHFSSIDHLIERTNQLEPKIQYDYHISLLSLPHYFKTSSQTIPQKGSYISSDTMSAEKWKRVISNNKNLKVGLAWAGNPHHPRDKHRSINYSEFASLLSLEGVDFFSLQKFTDGNIVSQAVDLGRVTRLEIDTFADTAAIIENLDLIISVDTSVAHLAGAMSKPVWNLIYYYPDWRWGLKGSTTTWYPSMKLFRQPDPLNWQSVLEKVEKELKMFVQLKSSNTGKVESKATAKKESKIIYVGMAKGNNFGWGVCNNYLKSELVKKIEVIDIFNSESLRSSIKVTGTVLHALVDIDMNSLFNVRGSTNVGYAFFENELTSLSLKNLKNYELVLVGSTWNKKKLEQAGFSNAEVLIQGIDPKIFYPSETESNGDYFKIFSGGKFELRKGQDLVLNAVKILQQKYRDIILVNAWYNYLPSTMTLMSQSKHLNLEHVGEKWQEYMSSAYKTNSLDQIGEKWKEYMHTIYKMNSIDAGRILTLPLVANQNSRELYMYTDLGLFPNRAEGGTNLVLMEYMACGKPVIASFATGHKDILTEENSIQLKQMKEYKVFNENKELIADWEEADMDEIISRIEYAYFHRDEIKKIGSKGAEDLKQYTWESTSDKLLKLLNRL